MPPPYPLLPALYQKPWGDPKPDCEPCAGKKTGDAPPLPPASCTGDTLGQPPSTPKPRLPPEASRGGGGSGGAPARARRGSGPGRGERPHPAPPPANLLQFPGNPGGIRAIPGRPRAPRKGPGVHRGRGKGGARRRAPAGPTRGPGGAKAPRGDDSPLPWRLWAALPPSPVQPGPPGGAKPARPGAPARRGLPGHRHRGPGAPGPAVPALRRRRGGPGPTGSPGGGHHRYRCR